MTKFRNVSKLDRQILVVWHTMVLSYERFFFFFFFLFFFLFYGLVQYLEFGQSD